MSRHNSADDDRRNDDATNWIAGEQAAQRAAREESRGAGGRSMSRDLCRECEICSAQEDGLCYYCMDGLNYGESPEVFIDQLEGSA